MRFYKHLLTGMALCFLLGTAAFAVYALPMKDAAFVIRIEAPRLYKSVAVLRGPGTGPLIGAPSWSMRSAFPGTPGISLISGQAGTDFAFLRSLQSGDRLWIQKPGKKRQPYRVDRITVTDEDALKIEAPEEENVLLLSTSYVLGSGPGGPDLHFVVIARPEKAVLDEDLREL